MKKASYILKSNYIFTSETLSYFKGAVVISGETILDVIKGDTGYEQYIDDQTQVIEYGDKLIMPGKNIRTLTISPAWEPPAISPSSTGSGIHTRLKKFMSPD